MSFDANVPNASQSPGLFPGQSNTNFTRLKNIINADHVFNDSAQATDGVHRQCTMIARASPGSLPAGTNSILYTWLDSGSKAQLRFYNGVTDQIITPLDIEAPLRVVGTQSVSGSTTVTAYADPGFTYAGTGWAIATGTSVFRFYSFIRSGTNDIHEIDSHSGTPARPSFSFSGNDLKITNNDSGTLSVTWSLIINRLN